MTAFYNEHDPFAAQWLRNLIAAGHLPEGVVDERSIEDVRAADLDGFDQCHFFAGIGGWPLALRLAGWPDDRPVWTGSCPCQPFSAAGQGRAFADERHLWPAFYRLIAERCPAIVFGEQVDAAVRWGWLDAVFDDLEAEGYACGAVVLPACSVGAPHRRQRIWWVAAGEQPDAEGSDRIRGVADANGGHASAEGLQRSWQHGQRAQDGRADSLADTVPTGRAEWRPIARDRPIAGGGASGVAQGDANLSRPQGRRIDRNGTDERAAGAAGVAGGVVLAASEQVGLPGRARLAGATACGLAHPNGEIEPRLAKHVEMAGRGFWSDIEWLPCTDGKARPTQSPIQWMADGLPESLGPVRAETIAEIESEIDGAIGQSRRGKAVFDLWNALAEETIRHPVGGLRSVQEAPVLLAFVCQLAEQGWKVAEGVPQSRTEASRAMLRMLRGDETPTRSPRGRGLDEQQSDESANALRVLSSILARHAQASWADAIAQNAKAVFPLASGIAGRVGMLRAYGNAIVPQVAQAFIEAVMEARP